MNPFGRRFPKQLERRRPENAEVRRQFDAQHKQRVSARADFAMSTTEENERRIAQVEAAVQALTARL